jgi:hypothetical protein
MYSAGAGVPSPGALDEYVAVIDKQTIFMDTTQAFKSTILTFNYLNI